MKNKILFLVEGIREEQEFERNILRYLNLNKENVEIITYGTSIHELIRLLNKPENDGLSLTAILIKNNLINVETNIQLDSTFSSIYLIFDFDPQYHEYDKNELIELTKRFDNETEDGKLLLNYPMFECLFDIEDRNNLDKFLDKKIDILTSHEYKKIVNSRTIFRSKKDHVFKHLDNKDDFILSATFNLEKYKHLMNVNRYDGVDQIRLLNLQLNEINNSNEFYVISSMVLLYFDYN